jgi:hypothetical protein
LGQHNKGLQCSEASASCDPDYTRRGKVLIIGGAKGTQKRDIKRALEMTEQLED